MKYILLLILLIGCGSNYNDLQENIDEFSRSCKRLSKCIDKPYKIRVDLVSNKKLTCIIKYSKVTNAYLYANEHLDMNKRPDFGYFFLQSAIETCKINKEIGEYSKENQDAMFRYKQCIDLDPDNEGQKKACWRQYRNGDFHTKENKNEITIVDGKVTEGHHRYMANN